MSTKLKLLTTTTKNKAQPVKAPSPFTEPLRAPKHCHKMAVSSKKRDLGPTQTQYVPQRLLAPKPDICHVWCLDIWWNSTKNLSFFDMSTLPTSPSQWITGGCGEVEERAENHTCFISVYRL